MSNGPEGGRRPVGARLVLALAAAALAGIAAPLGAHAASPPVTLNVTPEYATSGSTSTTWTPLLVTLSNSGPDFSGTVEIAVTGSGNQQRCISFLKVSYCGNGGVVSLIR